MGLDRGFRDEKGAIAFTRREIVRKEREGHNQQRLRALAWQQRQHPKIVLGMRGDLPRRDRSTHNGADALEAASVFAHELAQPLTAIINYVEACRRTLAGCRAAVPDTAFECIEKAARESVRAGKLIERLRCLLERGQPERRPTKLNKLIEETCDLLRRTAKTRAVTLELVLDPSLPDPWIDAVQIRMVVTNLVKNAIEAVETAPQRRIVVNSAPASSGCVEVSVSDSGPGLNPHAEALLFQPLASRKPAGMGIGLAICRAVVTAHGGRIWATSDGDGGTTFHFTLPTGEAVHDGPDSLYR